MTRELDDKDFDEIFTIINDAAVAYKGVIPEDRWHEPYMPKEELAQQIAEGVRFLGCEQEGQLIGVMGIQERGDVFLIRHAYVRTSLRKKGVGTLLIREITKNINKPILIGTWKSAVWAISFYQKNGYTLVSEQQKNLLLKKYWNIPERQIETSVVLADEAFMNGSVNGGES